MISNNMTSLRINAHGVIIQEIANELDSAEIQYNRSPICFSVNAPEWVNVALSTGGAISFVASIIIAYINKNRRVKAVFHEDGSVKEIEATNEDEMIRLLKEIKSLEIER
ncbi:hypothetical protein [Morganella morganii]|uniref:hypothetical protein n=1 Tax=Morganella TaxID=581 RepID=UPI0030344B6D|nr:hypothetical protein [Morganella morganii]